MDYTDGIFQTVLISNNDNYQNNNNDNHYQFLSTSNLMDGGAWWAAVHGVTKSRTWLSDFTFLFHFHALEKEMATHSSVLAWRIQGTVEPGGLPSMGSHRVGHDWSELAAAAYVYMILILYVYMMYTLNMHINIWF